MGKQLKPNKTQGINNPSKDVSPDLFVGHYGYEIVDKNKELIDSSYPSFRLHYVIKGSVILYYEGKKIRLKRHSMFILMPNTGISYQAEFKKSPTELYWVTFNGHRAKEYVNKVGLSESHPFTQLPDGKPEAFFYDNFIERDYSPAMLNLILQRNLINILDYLYQNRPSTERLKASELPELAHTQSYIEIVLKHIDKNLGDPNLSIRMFAEKFNVHPSTLSRQFKKELSICFTEYLSLKRVEYAVALLEEGLLKVNEVARMVGFEDPLYFSRVYRKYFHCSPMTTIRNSRKRTLNNPTPPPQQ